MPCQTDIRRFSWKLAGKGSKPDLQIRNAVNLSKTAGGCNFGSLNVLHRQRGKL